MRTALPAVLSMALAAGAFAAAGCGDDSAPNFRPANRGGEQVGVHNAARDSIKQKGAGLVEKGSETGKQAVAPAKLSETDFIEGVKHRDPFRPFTEVIARQEDVTQKVQREVKLKEYDVADLKLIAIVTNIGDERAMVVTPTNEGIVLRRGDYVGKPEYVETGAGEKIQVNWRVARIHGSGKDEERGVYLVRDDPLTETPEDVTRFVPLHPAQ